MNLFDKYRTVSPDPDRASPLDQWGHVNSYRLGSYWTVPVTVPLRDLAKLRGVVQNKNRLSSIRKAIGQGVVLPPIEVAVYRNGDAWLVDGNHRLVAARRAKINDIEVIFTFVGK